MSKSGMSKDNHTSCVILGGGGHASVIIDSILANGTNKGYGILDSDHSLWGQEVLGIPILGGDEMLPQLKLQGASHFVVGLGGVGNNNPRKRLFNLCLQHGLKPLTICHPAAIFSPFATIGEGSILAPAAVVNANAILGSNVIINTGAIIEHDCIISDHVHVATGSRLCSAVQIGIGAHIGAGSTVRQRVVIGEGAIIGAGAVVVNDVEPWTVVVGVPAHILRSQRSDTVESPCIAPLGEGSDNPSQEAAS